MNDNTSISLTIVTLLLVIGISFVVSELTKEEQSPLESCIDMCRITFQRTEQTNNLDKCVQNCFDNIDNLDQNISIQNELIKEEIQ